MKIVITSRGDNLDSAVDERFGRAVRFILYNTETQAFHTVDNQQSLNAVQGAGIQAAGMVSRQGAKCVLTGHCGPKAFQTLQTAGIRVYTGASGTVKEAIEAFQQGKLKEAGAADVAGHWA